MFTGIVEGIGTLEALAHESGGARLTIAHPGWDEGLGSGSSVAVDGCCLTVIAADQARFEAEVTRETLARTRFGSLTAGAPLNLERPLRLGDRLGGHWVQGHVDGIVRVHELERRDGTGYLTIQLPPESRVWVVAQGSVTLNGVSLTVLDVDDHVLRVAIIPHTWERTNLSRVQPGSPVHIEYDVLAKYVSAALGSRGA